MKDSKKDLSIACDYMNDESFHLIHIKYQEIKELCKHDIKCKKYSNQADSFKSIYDAFNEYSYNDHKQDSFKIHIVGQYGGFTNLYTQTKTIYYEIE